MANHTKLTAEKMARFLEVLSNTANVSAAAKTIRVSRGHLYEVRAGNDDFAAAWDEAVKLGTSALEDEAVRRATEGTLKPVFYKGQKCGTIREYSDTLLIFLLKARDPDKYADRVRKELTGPGGGPIQQQTQLSSVAEFQEVLKGIIDEV
ncbi:terminase [Chromobacterium haemolyticum]|uniref:Terminase n=1 Tax=Chromobacterium fluminis TaxID=3044269 RepID=A0ABX0L1N2_9NEIS|nr:terminase [Chromobacterium haemolyticum]NHR05737.1 terminase [Chromobacterium haemolyticum]